MSQAEAMKKKIDSELRHFLSSGAFGNINLDSSINEVCNALGSPDKITTEYWEINNTNITNLFYQNNFIFTFIGFELQAIIFYCQSKDRKLLSKLRISWLPLLQEMTYKSFCNYLKRNSIKCQHVNISPFQDEGILLWLPKAKLEIVFNAARNYHIDQISCLASRPTGWKLNECQGK